MTDVTLPWDDQPGEPENIDHVMENDEALRDAVNDLSADNFEEALRALLGLTGGGSTRREYAEVATEETLTIGGGATVGPLDLATPGPSVTVTVPTNGLVFAMAEMEAKSAAANLVSGWLLEDGANVFTSGAWSSGTPGAAGVYGKVWTSGGSAWGFTRRAAWSMFPAAAGARTYKLAYGGFNSDATFKNRKLWVATMGF